MCGEDNKALITVSAAAMALDCYVKLDQPISQLRFVSGARAKTLHKLGIQTVRDVLYHVPSRYLDFSHVVPINHADLGKTVTVVGHIDAVISKRPKPRLSLVEVYVVDQSGLIKAVFFRQPWIANQLHEQDLVALSGTIDFKFGFKQMNSPFFEVLTSTADLDSESFTHVSSRTETKSQSTAMRDAQSPSVQRVRTQGAQIQSAQIQNSWSAQTLGRIIPIHPATEGMSTAWIRRIISIALTENTQFLDWLPKALIARHRLMGEAAALRLLHFPTEMQQQAEARRRLCYDELLSLQLALLVRKSLELGDIAPHTHQITGVLMDRFREALPFKLHPQQQAALQEILEDMAAPHVMNRLLLGDVGTGKTVVAAGAAAAAAQSGTQVAMMAPTSVLAAQYARSMGPLLDAVGISWALLTGSTPARERLRIIEDVATNSCTVVFGTTALLSDELIFYDLSLTIIDEQHRFGVDQRKALRQKGRAADLLIMTATPIPRTLALSIHGDLDCSIITKRPVAGAGVTTKLLTTTSLDTAWGAVRKTLQAGQQVYVICPLVSEKTNTPNHLGVSSQSAASAQDQVQARLKTQAQAQLQLQDEIAIDELPDSLSAPDKKLFSAEELINDIAYFFPEATAELLTGRMKAEQKDQVMQDFYTNQVQILVATTVVEVGVDVPNATTMLIFNADRFGLATLHQLRGRVGRGSISGVVYAISDASKKSLAYKRLKAFAGSTNGFELAELDLAIRHEGEILGWRQSGQALLRFADLAEDTELIEAAYTDAREILEQDPELQAPEHALIAHELRIRFAGYFDEMGKSL